jgi:hypothetical protein
MSYPHSSFVVELQAESDMERLLGYGRTKGTVTNDCRNGSIPVV